MSGELSIEDLKEIASQLSSPIGEMGLVTSKNMASNNGNMILQTIAVMNLKQYESVLEIGPGGGRHVSLLFTEIGNLDYYGIDVSQLMVEEATEINASLAESGNITFSLTDGETVPYADAFFNKIFTVNTLYFWKDPEVYAREIYRVLKPGGKFYLSFAPKSFMEQLPFTQYGFELYDLEKALSLLEVAGFKIDDTMHYNEQIKVSAEGTMDREFIVVIASK
ncbi:MAG: class I SAM-dependent methyltransferase [Bacteroidota bacterium]